MEWDFVSEVTQLVVKGERILVDLSVPLVPGKGIVFLLTSLFALCCTELVSF